MRAFGGRALWTFSKEEACLRPQHVHVGRRVEVAEHRFCWQPAAERAHVRGQMRGIVRERVQLNLRQHTLKKSAACAGPAECAAVCLRRPGIRAPAPAAASGRAGMTARQPGRAECRIVSARHSAVVATKSSEEKCCLGKIVFWFQASQHVASCEPLLVLRSSLTARLRSKMQHYMHGGRRCRNCINALQCKEETAPPSDLQAGCEKSPQRLVLQTSVKTFNPVTGGGSM